MEITDTTPMPFGKYKGMKMQEIPAEYLVELLITGYCGKGVKKHIISAVMEYIREKRDILEQEMELIPMPVVDEDDLIDVDNSIDFDIFEE